MSAAYETETLVEGNTASNINKIFDYYQSAGLASAGIFQSMKKLRDARRNPGLCLRGELLLPKNLPFGEGRYHAEVHYCGRKDAKAAG